MATYEDPGFPGYRFEIGTGDEFTADLPAIEALVNSRRHVDADALHEHLPDASVIAAARHGDRIVSVCVLKGVRDWYNSSIERKSGFPIESDVPELGYAATDLRHEGNHLGGRMHDEVLQRAPGDVFATVRMPNTDEQGILERRGFRREGAEWKGQGDYNVGLWFRKKPS